MDWDIRMDCRGLKRTKGFSMEEQSANCRDISDFCNVKLGWKKKENMYIVVIHSKNGRLLKTNISRV